MFEEGINSNTKKVLNEISSVVNKMEFYLAGGTGLSLLLGHRESVDLDFFTSQSFNPKDLSSSLSGFNVIDIKSGTLIGKIGNVNVSFFEYKYPVLDRTTDYSSIKVASILDIALMKLSAVLDRNMKKDFIDLYFISKDHIPLLDLMKQFKVKYVGSDDLMIPILKSLIYFVDTEIDPMPHMFKEVKWEDVKEYFRKETSNVYSQLI